MVEDSPAARIPIAQIYRATATESTSKIESPFVQIHVECVVAGCDCSIPVVDVFNVVARVEEFGAIFLIGVVSYNVIDEFQWVIVTVDVESFRKHTQTTKTLMMNGHKQSNS